MVSGKLPSQLARQRGGCMTPNNFMDYLVLHQDCEDSDLALACRHTANDLESTADPRLIKIRKMVYSVMAENYRLRGFVRLSPLGEKLLYGFMEPRHKIGPRVAASFAYRFPRTIIILGNRRESWVALYNGGRVQHASGKGLNTTVEQLKELLGEEDKARTVEELWKTYYQSQYTPERRNMRLFSQRMPKKALKAAGAVAELTEDGCTSLDDFVD